MAAGPTRKQIQSAIRYRLIKLQAKLHNNLPGVTTQIKNSILTWHNGRFSGVAFYKILHASNGEAAAILAVHLDDRDPLKDKIANWVGLPVTEVTPELLKQL